MSPDLVKIVVGSKNPVKINAARQAVSRLFALDQVDCIGVDAPSGVAQQPMNAADTRQGAVNRVQYCQQHFQADFYIAVEGGVDLLEDGPATFAYVAIVHQQRMSVGRSASLPLPPPIYQELLQGQELGPLMDQRFNTTNIKQKGGAIALLTRGMVTREANYVQALTLSLAPFLHPDLYELC